MAHAAVLTAAKLSHFIPDVEPACKYCSAITRSNDASDVTEELESENIAHYFWFCPRVQDFWQRVSQFLQALRSDTAGPVFQVDLRMVTIGFGAWRSKLQNADAQHGMAVWEIFHARTELFLDGIEHSGEAMFIQWKSTLMLRIVQDLRFHTNQGCPHFLHTLVTGV
ncbi:hypothetical protein GGH94_004352 [Coemansia aciculifera]|uniref:Uncharacterized protein n=1 Tax=Coemansia aciculifera TaxID=417176 RepID=A0A9W8IFZ2_9FUNG|nr:hypothetical protein GGH94_004352 [Coemansia aciculifera]